MDAIYKHDPKAVPPRWRLDPVQGQVSLQTRLKIQGRDALVAVRLKVDRGQILEIEQLYDGNINAAAIPLLTTPRPGLLNDIPASERLSRELLLRAANSYFDALEGDNGKIAGFAPDCVHHENGYQTVNNPPPGWRNMPSPTIPSADTERTRGGVPPDAPPGKLQNLVTVETFGIRGGQIHEVEVFPFVTIPYGPGNGWTPGR
jgi:hypothetical protein